MRGDSLHASAAPGRTVEAAMAPRSEARVEAQPEHHCIVHVPERSTGGIQRPFERLIDDLQVESRVEPGGDGGSVIQLDGVLMAEAQTELLAQERNEVATDLHVHPADPNVVGVFDGVRHAVGGAELEEDADPPVGVL